MQTLTVSTQSFRFPLVLTVIANALAAVLALTLLLAAAPSPAVAQGGYEQQVQQMYVAYYGRPGDPEGVDYWSGRLAEVGGNWIADLVNAFGDSPEYTERFGSLPQETLTNNLFLGLFNRAADAEGLAYYVDLLNRGNLSGLNPELRQSTLAQIALDIANGASGEDSVVLQNKLYVADYFTDGLVETGRAYTAINIPEAATVIASVGASDASIGSAYQKADTFITTTDLGTGRTGHVTNIVDGDTLDANIDGLPQRVQLIGIDTPEVGECFYDEATIRLTQLALSNDAQLVKDVSETDRSDRLLRYVFVDGNHINLQMVREGYAAAAEYPPDTAYAAVFTQAEQDARAQGLGRWGQCSGDAPDPGFIPFPQESGLVASSNGWEVIAIISQLDETASIYLQKEIGIVDVFTAYFTIRAMTFAEGERSGFAPFPQDDVLPPIISVSYFGAGGSYGTNSGNSAIRVNGYESREFFDISTAALDNNQEDFETGRPRELSIFDSPDGYQGLLQELISGDDAYVRAAPNNPYFPVIEGSIDLDGFDEMLYIFDDLSIRREDNIYGASETPRYR